MSAIQISSVVELQHAILSNREKLQQYFSGHHQRDICYRMMEHFINTGTLNDSESIYSRGFMYSVVAWLNVFSDTCVNTVWWNFYRIKM